jgi:Zn-dependent M28 family amino/carboxypeptidase
MAATYTLISSVTLGSAAADITFTSIPATYTDLIVKFSTKEATTGSWQIFIDFNGTSSNRSSIRLQGNGSSSSAASTSNLIAATTVNITPFGSAEMYIPNYAGSNFKSVNIDSVSENNSAESYQILTAGLWSDTAAITSIKLYLSSGNIAANSTAYLYGISNA